MAKLKQLSYVNPNKARKNDLVNPPIGSSLRGSVIPLIIGTAEVTPVIGWVGHRTKYKMSSGGGKGGQGGDDQYGYRESALHYLCVGPATMLSAIYDGGSLFYAPEEPLTPFNTPSGSDVFPYGKVKYVYTHTGPRGMTIVVEKKVIENRRKGYFTIYWGDHFVDGVPVDHELAEYAKTGSLLPGVCYIVWKQVTLGSSPSWPAFTYEVSTTPYETAYDAGTTYSAGQITRHEGVLYWYKNNTPASGFAPDINPTHWYPLDTQNGLADSLTTIKHDVDDAPTWNNTTVYQKWDRVRSTDASDLFTYIYINDYPYANKPVKTNGFVNKDYWGVYRGADGVNPAALVKQLLLAPHPYGSNLPAEMVDMGSIEKAGVLFSAEKIAFNTSVADGDTAGDALETILEDAVCFLSYNEGKLVLVPLRDNPSVNEFNSASLDEGLVLISPKPSAIHAANPLSRNRVYYLYRNRHDAYADTDINYDMGSLESQAIYTVPEEKRLKNVTDSAVADVVAQRRYLVDSKNISEYEISGGRVLRGMKPGHVVYFPSLPEALRIINSELNLEDGSVKLDAISDIYDTEVIPYKTPGDATGGEADYFSEPDIFLAVYELPYALNQAETNSIIVVRQRANELIAGTIIRGTPSVDDDTYVQIQVQETLMSVAGSLADDIAQNDPFILPSVKLYLSNFFTDISTLPDLSGQDFKYNTGEVLVWINNEIFFFHSYSVVSGEPDAVILNNLIRARYDTARQFHAASSPVFFVKKADLLPITHNTIITNSPYYVCSQPYTLQDQLPLADAVAAEVYTDIIGRAANPLPCLNFKVNGGNTYVPGDALVFTWDYQVKKGNGTTPNELLAGEAILNSLPGPEGEFKLTFFDAGTKVHEVVVSEPTFTLSNLDLIDVFGGEPDTFNITLVNILDQRESYIVSLEIVRDESSSTLDTTPPQPNPIGWEVLPVATGSESITMTCAVATDPSGVEYFFECIDGPDLHTSGWQTSRTWTDTTLRPNTKYTYRVRTRDLSPSYNLSEWSESFFAFTGLSAADRPLTWMGVYDPAINYQVNDIVAYLVAGKYQSYVVKLETPSAGIVPTNTTYWDLLVSYGTDGVDGDDGADGTGGTGVVEIYIRSLTAPTVPTGAEISYLGVVTGLGSWSRYKVYANGTGYLWYAVAIVPNMPLSGDINLTFHAPIKEELGTERRIYINAATQPARPSDTVNPAGWSATPSSPPPGQYTWMSVATVVTDGSIVSSPFWSLPSRISGEQGPAGQAGAFDAAFPIPKGFNWRLESGYLRWDAGTLTFGSKVCNITANTGNLISAPSTGCVYFIAYCGTASSGFANNGTYSFTASSSDMFFFTTSKTVAEAALGSGLGKWVMALYVQQGSSMVWDTGVKAAFGNFAMFHTNNLIVEKSAQIKDLQVDTLQLANYAVSINEIFDLEIDSLSQSYGLMGIHEQAPIGTVTAVPYNIWCDVSITNINNSTNVWVLPLIAFVPSSVMPYTIYYNDVKIYANDNRYILYKDGQNFNILSDLSACKLLFFTNSTTNRLIPLSHATDIITVTYNGFTATRLTCLCNTPTNTSSAGTLGLIQGDNVVEFLNKGMCYTHAGFQHTARATVIHRVQESGLIFMGAGYHGTGSFGFPATAKALSIGLKK